MTRNKIYWVTPLTIILSFFTGVLLAIVHHLFYSHLNGTLASDQSIIKIVSKQQFSIAIGNTLAFLVQSMLALSITVSYMQVLWRALTTAKTGAKLADIDIAFSVLQDILGLFSVSVWRLQVLLFPMAAIFWLIPIPSIFTPGTLSIQSAPIKPNDTESRQVPQLNFVNPNFVKFSGAETNHFEYQGPSKLVERIAAATAAQGKILAITPAIEHLNASWSIDFWGPSVNCGNAVEPDRTAILENYVSFLQATGAFPLTYFSWGARAPNETLPFYNMSGSMTLNDFTLSKVNPLATFLAFTNDSDPLVEISANKWSNASIISKGGWSQIFVNMTIIRCDLLNSSYNLDFQYTNGRQTIAVSKDVATQAIAISPETNFSYPITPDETSTDNPCRTSNYNIYTCYNEIGAQKVSYKSIKDAFNNLLFGSIVFESEVSNSFITQTVLMDTIALQFLGNQPLQIASLIRSSDVLYTDSLFQPRGHLVHALERLFENITLRESCTIQLTNCRSDVTWPSASSLSVNVTFQIYGNTYFYDAKTLWLAYGLQISFAALAVVIGCISIWLNGVSYDANFSTVLRMCRVDIDNIASGHNKDLGKRNSYEDSGGKPLPKYLAETVVHLHAHHVKTSRRNSLNYREGAIVKPSTEITNATLLESGGHEIEGFDQVRLILASETMF
ncbi:hypothetical protein BCON_0382g00040 [Botryotinia convoluta]|uniref:Uncharacterized protein n=1 Tax=Botryotinia convoluta TaxID=54673 RepID=A0A4Z1HDW0_9HELO|nr:hypothetical protein BCON_0382g00040 [Botryotinia convoluta]